MGTTTPTAPTAGDVSFTQIEKVVMGLTPVLAALAGWVTAWIARHFPGVHVTKSQVIYAFVVGIAALLFIVYHYLIGGHKLRNAKLQLELRSIETFATSHASALIPSLTGGALNETQVKDMVVAYYEAHSADIYALVHDVEAKLPGSVAETMQNLLKDVNVGDLFSGKVDLAAKLAAKAPGATTAGTVTPASAITTSGTTSISSPQS